MTSTHTVRVWNRDVQDYVSVVVKVEVDTRALAEEYAARAVANKSKTAKQCHGAVKIVAID
jgi:hypothetical protein